MNRRAPTNLAPICMRERLASIVLLSALLLLIPPARAADVYLGGAITNITSNASGLLIILDTGLPTNCTGSPYGWMLIRESNKTMIALTLMAWHSGNRNVTVYTDTLVAGSYCTINQVDPW